MHFLYVLEFMHALYNTRALHSVNFHTNVLVQCTASKHQLYNMVVIIIFSQLCSLSSGILDVRKLLKLQMKIGLGTGTINDNEALIFVTCACKKIGIDVELTEFVLKYFMSQRLKVILHSQ